MGTVSVAAVLAAVDLVTTVVQLRAPGTDLLRVPAFAWATVVSGVVVLLAVPVFVAGLTVLYIDVAHGGRIFTGRGGPVLWQHAVWLYGRPEVYGALLVPALGAVIDIVHPGLHREEGRDRALAEGGRVQRHEGLAALEDLADRVEVEAPELDDRRVGP